jgi:putative membrane protein
MNGFFQLLLRWAILALGVVLATKLVPGIRCDDGGALVAVVVLLSFFNAILKPLLVLFTLPFIVLTMGLGVIVINALLFLFVGRLVDGFHVASFWSAVGGALIVSLTNVLLSGVLRSQQKPPGGGSGASAPAERGPRRKSDDVIDI